MSIDDLGVIRVRRDSAVRDRLGGRYTVVIDGIKTGRIANGEMQEFSVVPGQRTVRVTVDRLWGSPELRVDVKAGQVTTLVCRPGGAAWRGVIDLFRPGRYIALDAVKS
jgi:hypothetical protein